MHPIPHPIEEHMMAMLGLESMAYVKQVAIADFVQYAVFAADGTQLATFDTQEIAYFNAIKHNLAPVSIH